MSHQFVTVTLNSDRQFIVTGNKQETMGQIAVGILSDEGTRLAKISGFCSWNMDRLMGFRRIMQVVQQHLIATLHATADNGYVAVLVGVPKDRESAALLATHFSHCFHSSIGYAFTPHEVEKLLGPKTIP